MDAAERERLGLNSTPLVVQTTQEMGLQVPTGLVLSELRTSTDQALVIDAGADGISLDRYENDDFQSTNVLETSVVRSVLQDGLTEQL